MKIEKIFKIFLIIVVLGLALLAFRSIMRPEKFKMVYNARQTEISKRLSALRSIQTIYKNEHKRYTDNIDSLVLFVESGSINIIKTIGDIPEGVSEEDAFKRGLIKNDTILVPAKEKILETDEDLNADILKVFHLLPESGGKKYEIQLGSIKSDNYDIPVFRVDIPLDDILINMDKAITPEDAGIFSKIFGYLIYNDLAEETQYKNQYKDMWLGSLTESTQSGSWE